jgi:hypothetical protein
VRDDAFRLTFSATVTWRFQFAPSAAFAPVEREYRVRCVVLKRATTVMEAMVEHFPWRRDARPN